MPIPRLGVHSACRAQTSLDGLVVVGVHSGVLQRLIKQIKYRGYFDMVPVAVKLMIKSLPKTIAADAITSVPLHSSRQRERGFNQSELLAKALAKQLGIPYQQLLRRSKATKPQANLNHSMRISNVAGAFPSLYPKLKGQVLIIDDVATTGATLNACASGLKAVGCKSVIGVVLSHKN